MELVERLVSIGMPRELALLSGDLAEALGKKTELPQGKLGEFFPKWKGSLH